MNALSTAAIGGGRLSPAASPSTNTRTAVPNADRDGADVLTFSDVSSDLFQLRYQQPSSENNLAAATNSTASSTAPLLAANANSAAATATSTPNSSRPNPRKPSPGLAARLKALGFGGGPGKPSPPPLLDPVGRLPEEQIRKLEHDHLQGSSAGPPVERRGRPWCVSSRPLVSPARRIPVPRVQTAHRSPRVCRADC